MAGVNHPQDQKKKFPSALATMAGLHHQDDGAGHDYHPHLRAVKLRVQDMQVGIT
jgi:hypothetical protein